MVADALLAPTARLEKALTDAAAGTAGAAGLWDQAYAVLPHPQLHATKPARAMEAAGKHLLRSSFRACTRIGMRV